jgi:hypothetical protein
MVGHCYFMVTYMDSDLRYPQVHTLVYLRQGRTAEGNEWIFGRSAPVISESDEATQGGDRAVAFRDDQLHMVVDVDALHLLLKANPSVCGAKPDESTVGAAEADSIRKHIAPHVAAFLRDPELVSLVVRILYTDSGFSCLRRDDGPVQMTFFLDSAVNTEAEARIRAVFASAGVKPCEDYLAGGGRTRVLAFPMPGDDDDAIAALGAEVLTHTYGMRSGDALEFVVR